MSDLRDGTQPGDVVTFSCTACGKPKPNDLAWPRPVTACECGNATWGATVTFSETPEGIVPHGDVEYGLVVPDA